MALPGSDIGADGVSLPNGDTVTPLPGSDFTLPEPESQPSLVDKGVALANKFIDEASEWNFADVPAEEAGAFLLSLLDGYTFGAAKLILGQLGLKDEIAKLDERNPKSVIAGDLVSFISPAGAVKVWAGAAKLASKLGKGLLKAERSVVEEIAKRGLTRTQLGLEAKLKKLGNKLDATDEQLAQIERYDDYVEHTLMKSGLDAKVVSQLDLLAATGADNVKDVLKSYQRLSDEIHTIKESLDEIRTAAAFYESKVTDVVTKAIDKGSKGAEAFFEFTARFGLAPVDVYQTVLMYKNIRQWELDAGETEQVAEEKAFKLAVALVLGKASRKAASYLLGANKKPAWWAILLRTPLELAAGLTILKGGDIQELAKTTGELAENLIDRGQAYLEGVPDGANTGALIARKPITRHWNKGGKSLICM